jgi:hypothetical protein
MEALYKVWVEGEELEQVARSDLPIPPTILRTFVSMTFHGRCVT